MGCCGSKNDVVQNNDMKTPFIDPGNSSDSDIAYTGLDTVTEGTELSPSEFERFFNSLTTERSHSARVLILRRLERRRITCEQFARLMEVLPSKQRVQVAKFLVPLITDMTNYYMVASKINQLSNGEDIGIVVQDEDRGRSFQEEVNIPGSEQPQQQKQRRSSNNNDDNHNHYKNRNNNDEASALGSFRHDLGKDEHRESMSDAYLEETLVPRLQEAQFDEERIEALQETVGKNDRWMTSEQCGRILQEFDFPDDKVRACHLMLDKIGDLDSEWHTIVDSLPFEEERDRMKVVISTFLDHVQ
eukprot:gb/GECH01001652.1/.p1 GENE.gb/GECH01001652.1/~~gb/GECH01001652.1/.p1  ORF type:complete len:302 (+),score=79.09 gb/GECH01001652.1/:1-906(+)